MIEIKLNRIIVPEGRFREVFNEKKLLDLRASILNIGLLHPITVEFKQQGDGDYWILRAGGRRLRALVSILSEGKKFKFGQREFDNFTIPALNYGELSALERLEVEVSENIDRADFDWKERTKALAALHELRKLQNPEQTLRATAEEASKSPGGASIAAVSNAVLLQKHLDDPDVAKAKSENEAMKIIRKKADEQHRAKLAVNFDSKQIRHSVIHGEAQASLGKIASSSFDVILADPPYGIGADSFGDMAGTGHEYKDSQVEFDSILKWLPDETYRVSKERAHCYLFCARKQFEKLHTLMVLAGWKVFDEPLIWDKCGTGMLPHPEHGPRRTYESILYAWKGDRRTLLVKNDVVRVPAVKRLLHGAQKPVALYCNLLSRSANPGDTVLDCFGGSGTVLVAANRSQLLATYIEREEVAVNIALTRIAVNEFDDGVVEDDGIEISL